MNICYLMKPQKLQSFVLQAGAFLGEEMGSTYVYVFLLRLCRWCREEVALSPGLGLSKTPTAEMGSLHETSNLYFSGSHLRFYSSGHGVVCWKNYGEVWVVWGW